MLHTLQLDGEAALPSDIQPLHEPVDFAAPPSTIFLTGATGLVAAYLLAELIEKTHAKIFTLVRAESYERALDRVRANLSQYALWTPAMESRVIPVVGDLKLPLFGLSQTAFDTLSQMVDVIYHVGSKLSYIAPYAHLKPANVDGTTETLRLAVTGKAKPYHFVSLLGILLGYRNLMGGGEGDPLDPEKCPQVGYFQTKYVAEALVRAARDRGIPVTIHRIGLIVGDAERGYSNPDDLVARILIGCIQAGYGPDIPHHMDMTPVDFIARAIVYFSTQPASMGKVFHLLNPQPITWSGIMDTVVSVGYPVKKLPFERWIEAIEEHEDPLSNPLHPLLPFFHIDIAGRMLGINETAYRALGTQFTQDSLIDSGVVCPPVDAHLIRTFLTRMVETGRLHAASTMDQVTH